MSAGNRSVSMVAWVAVAGARVGSGDGDAVGPTERYREQVSIGLISCTRSVRVLPPVRGMSHGWQGSQGESLWSRDDSCRLEEGGFFLLRREFDRGLSPLVKIKLGGFSLYMALSSRWWCAKGETVRCGIC